MAIDPAAAITYVYRPARRGHSGKSFALSIAAAMMENGAIPALGPQPPKGPRPVTEPTYDILGIGNAIVDVVAQAEEAFLSRHDMHKGAMQLIDAAAADTLYAAMPPGLESSGGSVANSCAVAAALGARVAYIGKVANDQLGQVFRHDIKAVGVHFPTEPLVGGAPTARCLILVTPDGQRTMNTFLGACVTLDPADVRSHSSPSAKVTYLEGYLFDPPAAQAASIRRRGRRTPPGGRSRCRCRTRSASTAIARRSARWSPDMWTSCSPDEVEITSLYEKNSFEAAAELARADVGLAVLTRSEDGSVILRGAETVTVEAVPARVIDTTGAGDAYAAGFLTGLTAGKSLADCGRLGSIAAAEVISHLAPGRRRI